MTRAVRVALTETRNAYAGMPERVEDLPRLAGHLEEVRRANVDHHVALMEAAAARGVQVIGFGELFTGPYFALGTLPLWTGLAEDLADGPTVAALRAAARRLRMIVVAPLYERDASGRRFNTAVVIDETGAVLGKYRKTHLPDGKNEQGSFHEPFYYERSDGRNECGSANLSRNPYFPVFRTSACRIGVAICYDRHFEGVMATLAAEGAELVLSPAVTFGDKSRRMWRLEFAVDAARHRLYIGGSNRIGREPPWNQPYFGDSHFVGPDGDVASARDAPGLVIADLDLDALAAPDPSGWNLPRDARPEIYGRPR